MASNLLRWRTVHTTSGKRDWTLKLCNFAKKLCNQALGDDQACEEAALLDAKKAEWDRLYGSDFTCVLVLYIGRNVPYRQWGLEITLNKVIDSEKASGIFPPGYSRVFASESLEPKPNGSLGHWPLKKFLAEVEKSF